MSAPDATLVAEVTREFTVLVGDLAAFDPDGALVRGFAAEPDPHWRSAAMTVVAGALGCQRATAR